MNAQTVGELGEFGLIERLRARLNGFATHPQLVVGIGDDAAVWQNPTAFTITTTDTMVEGVHFLQSANPRDVGWKALAVNASDIAAMGGTPSFALITLCLPPKTSVEWVDGLYEGMIDFADEYHVTIAGGDIVSSPALTITVALTGSPTINTVDGSLLLLRRGAAQPGDVIAVSGELGGSAGGLRVVEEHLPPSDHTRKLVRRHTRPEPLIGLGRAAAPAGLRCAIDVSDGLVQDVGHICQASGCGAIVRFDDIPVDPALLAVFPDDARMLAATGGEDYNLVLVGPESVIRQLGSVTVIGEMVADPEHRVRVLDADGNEVQIARGGWDHLRARA